MEGFVPRLCRGRFLNPHFQFESRPFSDWPATMAFASGLGSEKAFLFDPKSQKQKSAPEARGQIRTGGGRGMSFATILSTQMKAINSYSVMGNAWRLRKT